MLGECMKFMYFIMALVPLHLFGADLTVKLNRVPSSKGKIRFLLFADGKGFPSESEKSFRKGSVNSGEEIRVKDLPKGMYALSVIHDENENDELDTNFMGMPREAFGFSNNPMIYFGPPSFEKAKFSLDSDTELTINLKSF